MLRDNDFGVVRVRAFGTYDFRIVEPATFLREVAGSDHNFRLDEFGDTMRSRIVSLFTDAIASAKVPVLDVASRYNELGDALLPMINPAVTREVRPRDHQLHRRERVGAARGRERDRQARQHDGDRQSQRLREVPDGAGLREGRRGAGAAGTAAELAVGFGLAQQMMQQGFTGGAAAPSVAPELLGPADAAKALGVSEADVMAVLESGELKGKKIGSSWRITRAALNAYLAE